VVGGSSISFMMPKIARKTLGLADGSFSHVGIDGHAVVFRGEGLSRPVTLPVSMMGTFHSDILNNLFLYVRNNRQNGLLGVTTGPLTKAVFFKRGHIVFSGSTDATERIGAILLRHEFMTKAQIREVEEHDDPRRFGVRCREAGFITQEQLWEALRTQVVHICCSLVDFPVGTFFFVPNCVPEESFNRFFIEPAEVLFQGVIRQDEKQRALGVPESVDARSPLEVLAAMEDGDVD
jgi:hypothetical protein